MARVWCSSSSTRTTRPLYSLISPPSRPTRNLLCLSQPSTRPKPSEGRVGEDSASPCLPPPTTLPLSLVVTREGFFLSVPVSHCSLVIMDQTHPHLHCPLPCSQRPNLAPQCLEQVGDIKPMGQCSIPPHWLLACSSLAAGIHPPHGPSPC